MVMKNLTQLRDGRLMMTPSRGTSTNALRLALDNNFDIPAGHCDRKNARNRRRQQHTEQTEDDNVAGFYAVLFFWVCNCWTFSSSTPGWLCRAAIKIR
jgi:hypothetical protein